MEYIGFYNLKTRRVSKIYTKEDYPSKKNQTDFIFFHTHPTSKFCKNNIPSYKDIIFTIENKYPVHFIFIKKGIYILKKEKNATIPSYPELKLCKEKNIIKKLNKLFHYKNISFEFISYQEINTCNYQKEIQKIISKLLLMEPPFEINVQIHLQ